MRRLFYVCYVHRTLISGAAISPYLRPMPQSTNHILLVRPASFGANAQTKVTNTFQQELLLTPAAINQKAQQEFDAFAATLQAAGIHVLVVEDTPQPSKPDAVFPNNWISLHPDGSIFLYPMHTPNRMAERRLDIVEALKKSFKVASVTDFHHPEKDNWVLEGTGSIVFDHIARKAYACQSPRTNPILFNEVCERLQYQPILFDAYGTDGTPIYHTNVMMCVGEGFAVICLDSITDIQQKELVAHSLIGSGHELIEISLKQMNQFAGNMLQLTNKAGQSITVMSQTAFNSLTTKQRQQLETHTQLLPIPIPTIETIGGGSARCMMAEIFLPTH